MALVRIQSLEQFHYQAPGEWDKLLGLDRIPNGYCKDQPWFTRISNAIAL
jgi:hypothetical protein